MDDFYILGNSFDWWLNNLNDVIKRCEDCNLVLNWEKMSLYGERRHSVGPSHLREGDRG